MEKKIHTLVFGALIVAEDSTDCKPWDVFTTPGGGRRFFVKTIPQLPTIVKIVSESSWDTELKQIRIIIRIKIKWTTTDVYII